ncbi:MAG: PadR family transcriptional regulator [Bacilli bacterium]
MRYHWFESSVSHFFEASFGGIYPALHRMERDGLVTKDVVAQDSRPNKNLFAITETGRQAFHLQLESTLRPEWIRSDFLLRVFFGRYVAREQFIRWLEEERDRVAEKLRKLEVILSVPYHSFQDWQGSGWMKRDESYRELKERMTETVLAYVEQRYPGFRDLVAYKELSTPLTVESFTGHHRGAIYGLPATPERIRCRQQSAAR